MSNYRHTWKKIKRSQHRNRRYKEEPSGHFTTEKYNKIKQLSG